MGEFKKLTPCQAISNYVAVNNICITFGLKMFGTYCSLPPPPPPLKFRKVYYTWK